MDKIIMNGYASFLILLVLAPIHVNGKFINLNERVMYISLNQRITQVDDVAK